ncbi:MAG: TerC family protein [Calditrichaeota bacterium]|nr:TerC family protein [Calditrichota bacterium]
MDWITDPNAWAALLTLTALEIVLGIDNIIFIAILAGRLPKDQQKRGRFFGLLLAMVTRILLLLSLTWMMKLTRPIFTLFMEEISGRDLILIIGGLFLLAKSTMEIHHKIEDQDETDTSKNSVKSTFLAVVIQIGLLDIVFSLDSVITAIGMAESVIIMIIAVVISIIFMIFFINSISDFVDRHPTIKILALSFLLLIGVALIAEGLSLHIPKAYIYFAMAFSLFVEMINMRVRKAKEEN